MGIENTANETRALAASLRIRIEELRDLYWTQIDKSDNDSMDSATQVAKRLNEAIGEVDATLHAIDMAVELMEDYLTKRANTAGHGSLIFDDQTDEDGDDGVELEAVGVAAFRVELAAAAAATEDQPYVRRDVTVTKTRVRDGVSTLPEGTWLTLKNDFSYTKPTVFSIDGHEISGLSNWKGLYLRFLRFAHKLHPEEFLTLEHYKFPGTRRPFFSRRGVELIDPHRVGEFYVETNLSAKNIASMVLMISNKMKKFNEINVQIRHVEKTRR